MGFYDDHKYGVNHEMKLLGRANQTSVRASQAVADRHTFMDAVTVKDFNVYFVQGDTTTGTSANHNAWVIGIGKSAAGTGAISLIGTAYCGTAGQADGSVLDGSVTETNFSAGDDIVLTYEAGTALPAGVLRVEATVKYVERYT